MDEVSLRLRTKAKILLWCQTGIVLYTSLLCCWKVSYKLKDPASLGAPHILLWLRPSYPHYSKQATFFVFAKLVRLNDDVNRDVSEQSVSPDGVGDYFVIRSYQV